MADGTRIGAAEQLGAYARLLDVPMRTVCDAQELAVALAGFRDRDQVYVDTAGLTGEVRHGAALAELLGAAAAAVETTAVVAATASEAALGAAWRQLGALAPRACIVTKVDEGAGLATACGWLADRRLPLAWLGTGTQVPDDLQRADGEAVAAWLVAA